MQHLMLIILIWIAHTLLAIQAQRMPYYQPIARYREPTDVAAAEQLPPEYATSIFNANNSPTTPQQHQPNLYAPQPYPERVLLFHNQMLHAPATTRDQQLRQAQFSAQPTMQQLWSGPPIVVGYNEGSYADQEQQLLERRKYAKPTTVHNIPSAEQEFSRRFNSQLQTAQATSERKGINSQFGKHIDVTNFDAARAQQQQQVTPSTYPVQPQSNAYRSWSQGATTPFYAANYADHFGSYVRKYPYRLQPIFSPSDYGTQ